VRVNSTASSQPGTAARTRLPIVARSIAACAVLSEYRIKIRMT
jgi:hypothetical protein